DSEYRTLLSTAEAEYIALSQALRKVKVIPLIALLEKLNEIFPLHIETPKFVCKVHEDNQSCTSLFVKSGRVTINYCRTTEQKADLLTKPLADELFIKLRYMLSGW
ncbi:hypothetical protein ACHAXR_002938, partial [Thalassiosira sp. AJA248-18]